MKISSKQLRIDGVKGPQTSYTAGSSRLTGYLVDLRAASFTLFMEKQQGSRFLESSSLLKV